MHPRPTMARTCSSPRLVAMAEVGSLENATKTQARVQSCGSQARPVQIWDSTSNCNMVIRFELWLHKAILYLGYFGFDVYMQLFIMTQVSGVLVSMRTRGDWAARLFFSGDRVPGQLPCFNVQGAWITELNHHIWLLNRITLVWLKCL